jgi:DNA-directed RNA polymerase subunit RPC12/RpoP
MKPYDCLRCKRTSTARTHVNPDDDRAKKGSVSICAYCGATAMFTEDGSLRELTPTEWIEILDEPAYRVAQLAVRDSIRRGVWRTRAG